MGTHDATSGTEELSPRLLEPGRVLRILGISALIGSLFLVASMLVPHPYTRYDPQFYLLAGVLLLSAPVILRLSRRPNVSALTVQACCWYLSIAILAMAWLAMADLAGVQSVFLMLILGISALLGPGIATWGLLAAQSAGYAAVLATSSDRLGLDRFGQWMSLSMGLLICVVAMRAMRTLLEQSSRRDARIRDERANERQQYAERLERVNAELREAVELKGRFVAMASHELRTPLTAISGFAATITHRWDTLTPAEMREFVEIIEDQAGRLSRLVADLLTLSRIESGRVSARPERLHVREQVERILRELEMDDVEVACEPSLLVEADAEHLQQIITNFLTNARSYGAAPYTVEATLVDGAVHLVVADSGEGVEEGFVPELFERFTRNAPMVPATSDAVGTGLGLSIVDGLAQAHGGYAWYEPNSPHGSRFGVSLPAAPAA